MRPNTGLILGLFLLHGFIPPLAEASLVDFHITGSLTAGPSIFGWGDQYQGIDPDTGQPKLVTDIPITGEIDVDLDYDFSINHGETYAVYIDNMISISDLNLDQNISSFEEYNITADFNPSVHTLNFALNPELSVQYSPFFGMYLHADYGFQGFGFPDFDVLYNGQTYTLASLSDELTIDLHGHLVTFSPTRSIYGCGDLGAMGGFEITNLGDADPDPAPEPATLLLFGAGLLGLFGNRLRKQHSL
ncbi:MAG: PEP-CTERM sorting domain-containing protein [Proteobacteria bacterium]|nr:PEP-CTERM sorting domain-containing protein [Pseudomonadota bacterium]